MSYLWQGRFKSIIFQRAKNSTIWLRKNEDSRPIAVRNASDLYNLIARLELADEDTVG